MKDYYNLIEDYLNQELDEIELKQFEEELAINPALKAQLNEHQKLLERFEAYKIREKVNLAHKSIQENNRWYVNYTFKIAASISLLFGVGLYIYFTGISTRQSQHIVKNILIDSSQQSNQIVSYDIDSIIDSGMKVDTNENSKIQNRNELIGLLISSFIPFTTNLMRDQIESSDSISINLQIQAEQAFFNNEFDSSLQVLSRMLPNNTEESAILLRAHCFLKLGNYNDALLEFKKLRNSFEFKYEANYNFMLLLFMLNRESEAQDIMRKILEDKDHPYYHPANILYKNINSVKPIGLQKK